MGMYIRRQRIPQCSLPPKTALPRLRGGLIATLAAEIMFPCEVRTKLARSSYEVGSNFVRSWAEVGSKFVRIWAKVGSKFVRSWAKVRTKLARSSFEVGPKFVRN